MPDNLDSVTHFIKESVEALLSGDATNCRLILDDDLALFVGWEGGFGKSKRDDCIQDKDNPDYAIVAGIKCWRSDDLWTDYEFLNYPYFEDGGVWDTGITLKPGEDYWYDAVWFIDEWNALQNYEFRDDGLIISSER